MSTKYDSVLSDLLTRFYVNSDVDETTRRIVKDVVSAEMSKMNLKTPHKILVEIREIIDKEAKRLK
jgi:hypothetical protein